MREGNILSLGAASAQDKSLWEWVGKGCGGGEFDAQKTDVCARYELKTCWDIKMAANNYHLKFKINLQNNQPLKTELNVRVINKYLQTKFFKNRNKEFSEKIKSAITLLC